MPMRNLQRLRLILLIFILLQSLNMRKYLKSKDQLDNNSQIFKEAKRRFHYEPSQKEQKYFLLKNKQTNTTHQFKEDFSSVKEAKNENNQINESSWIVKLVNVMHQNSEEDVKTHHIDPNHFQFLRPIQSREIQVIQPKNNEIPLSKESTNLVTPLTTKKNSINMNKKKSKSQKSQSCDTVSRKGKSHLKVETIKRSKNQVNIKRNHSQSLFKSDSKENNSKIKSMRNISNSKIASSKMKIEANSQVSEPNGVSSKHCSVVTGIDSKQSMQISKHPIEYSKDKLKFSIQENKIEEQQKENFESTKQKHCNILVQQIGDDLFSQSSHHKNSIKGEVQLTAQKRAYVGSIKKNRPTQMSERKSQTKNTKIEFKASIIDHKYTKSDFKCDNKYQIARSLKKDDEQDIVTARQQQNLIDKYLNNDYSFKKQSNLFKYDYNTSDFQRSLSHLNKPVIILDKPSNTSKTMNKKVDSAKLSQKYYNNAQNEGQMLMSKRQIHKKFNYFSDKADRQTTQNSLSLEILTLKYQQQTPKLQQIPNQLFKKMPKKEQIPIYQNINKNNNKQVGIKSNNEYDLKRIHQKYNYQINKQRQPIADRKKSISQITTKRYAGVQNRPGFINRTRYLEESTCKNQQTLNERISYPSFDYPTFKCDQQTFKCESRIVPNKQEYIEINSEIYHLNAIERKSDENILFGEVQSEELITKLNSKLNNYINQYNLQKPYQPETFRQNQPTHRKMNLNFNQLKKHREFSQK